MALAAIAATARALPPPDPYDAVLSVVNLEAGVNGGTGVMTDWGILTAAHVVRGGGDICVKRNHVPECDGYGSIIAIDVSKDLALVSSPIPLPARHVSPISFRSGEEVIAIGYAFQLDGPPTVTRGIISALRTDRGKQVVQFDAGAAPGVSGGPLVSLRTGEIVGIIFGGVGNSHIHNLATPPETVMEFLNAQPR